MWPSSGEARCCAALACLEGKCAHSDAFDMRCIECDAGVHGAKCLGLTKGKVAIGIFQCVGCRLTGAKGRSNEGPSEADAEPGEPPSPSREARMLAAEAMLSRMAAGSEGFGGAMAKASKLQTEFTTWMTKEMGSSVALPIDSEDSMILFMRWMASRRHLV